jgi:Rad3-related DNA helicase
VNRAVSPDSAAQLLSADGPFAAALDGFAPREAQRQMADAAQEAFASGASLVC